LNYHHERFRKLTFQALALRQSECAYNEDWADSRIFDEGLNHTTLTKLQAWSGFRMT